jgi:RNA polymerase sigma-70 factor (ECF subfamily)
VSALEEAFTAHRRLLFAVAYQMLGSVADAEDVVQDTWLRWSAADRGNVEDDRAYLVTVASRLALDRLRAARTKRESYVGPWLPEPLVTPAPDGDPQDVAERADEVSLALLVVLETLSPAERAVFVLREVFGLPVPEVAAVLGRSEAAVRQMAHRAREHVQARRPRFPADRRTAREVTDRFLAACTGGDVDELMAVLAPGVVLVSDGGGRTRAALRPLEGADKVARWLTAVSAQGGSVPGLELTVADVNGAPAVVARTPEGPYMVLQLVLSAGRVEQVLVVVNPEKLARLDAAG